ncbi:NAD-dependent succinate-semialdehyde dehydrogenase [Elongatibacter sediminis]|uniref:NAD-dependent succinate-semialdehyde dehydrogenase n=1 Tax=Elongatibacter sediminis TaxID=3119006 RepID=A0AAW9RG73_9GAMM
MMNSLELTRPELLRHQNFIRGTWSESAGGATLEVINPASNRSIASVPDSDARDARAAVEAATAAFKTWRQETAMQRRQLLKEWHRLLLENGEDLARLMSLEQGKPLAEARGEVAYGASYVEWFAEEAVRVNGDILPSTQEGRRQMVIREPVGVVAVITPWNFPLAMIARKIAPALAVGCTVVAKPSEDTPLTALALARLAEEAGFPPGTVNVLSASRSNGALVGDAWLADGRVRKITFTGSTPVGKHLARESAETLKRLSLELGGNAPFIVFEDADLDLAVAGLMASKFRNGGQTCVCPNRVFVQQTVLDEFVTKLQAAMESLVVGPATHPDATIGPMINSRAVEKIQRHVDDALERGARLVCGGERVQNAVAAGPHFYLPTILTNVGADAVMCHEETFGPVIPVIAFENEPEVVTLANDTPYGLAAYFYTSDMRRAFRLPGLLEAGVIGINEGAVASELAPFGGVKESGYGREGSVYGTDDYVQIKYLCQGQLGGET